MKRTEVVFPSLKHLIINSLFVEFDMYLGGCYPQRKLCCSKNFVFARLPKVRLMFSKAQCCNLFITQKSSRLMILKQLKKNHFTDKVTDTESWCISLEIKTLLCLSKRFHIWKASVGTKLLFEYLSVYYCPQLKIICIDFKLKQTLKEILEVSMISGIIQCQRKRGYYQIVKPFLPLIVKVMYIVLDNGKRY